MLSLVPMVFALLLSLLLPDGAIAQRSGGGYFPFTRLPPPSREAQAVVRPCPQLGRFQLSEPLNVESGIDPRDKEVAARVFNIIEWGHKHLKFSGELKGCGSRNEILKVWQETFGPAVTGQLGKADLAQYDIEIAKLDGPTATADARQPRQDTNAPTAAQPSPLPAGSAWIGNVRCGTEKWDAAIRVDSRDNSLAEFSAIIDQQTRTTRSRITAKGAPGSFDIVPLDPAAASDPFALASGTVRVQNVDGQERQIISWRPVDGPFPRCIIGMRVNPGGVDGLTPAAVQGAMKLFGLTFNGPLEVPTCKVTMQQVRRCTPSGLQCWNDTVRVEEDLPACFVADRSHIRFLQQSQPGWARGPIGIRLDRENRVVHVEFIAANGDNVLKELYSAFGSPTRIDSKNRSQSALASCLIISGVVDCQQIRQARDWTEYTQVWRTSSLEARFDEGSNRTVVTSLISR